MANAVNVLPGTGFVTVAVTALAKSPNPQSCYLAIIKKQQELTASRTVPDSSQRLFINICVLVAAFTLEPVTAQLSVSQPSQLCSEHKQI